MVAIHVATRLTKAMDFVKGVNGKDSLVES